MEPGYGIVSVKSTHSFAETCERFALLVGTRAGFIMFADIDFARDAGRSGLVMRPTRLFVFGNPASGTPLMQVAPSSAMDLPLKVLVSQDAVGAVWVSYNSPGYLAERHGIPKELLKNIAGIEQLVAKAAGPEPLLGG